MDFYQHQVEGVAFLSDTRYAVNADDMGLGKSLEALLTLDRLECRHVLIVCPASLKYNWKNEIEKWLPGSTISMVGTSKSDRFEDREEQINSGARFTIINFDLIGTVTRSEKDEDGIVVNKKVDLRHRLSLVKGKWDGLVIDEAHKVRNRKSKAFLGIQTIITHSELKAIIPMTGTPFYTKVDNLWPLIHFVDRKRFPSFHRWAEETCELRFTQFSPWPQVVKIKDPAAVQASLSDIMLRRRKEDVLDLPPKTIINLDVDLFDTHRRIYDKLAKDLYVILSQSADGVGLIETADEEWGFGKEINAVNIISLIQRQRQIAISPDIMDISIDALTGAKMDAMIDIIDGLGDQKMVIFSQFATVIRRAVPIIEKRLGIKGTMFTGKTPQAKRHTELEKFQQESQYKFHANTTQSGGTGLNMTAASVVSFFDLMWAPGDNAQAVDRVNRIGQDKPITVYNINARNTIEDRVLKLLGDRAALFDSLLPITTVTAALNEGLLEELKETGHGKRR